MDINKQIKKIIVSFSGGLDTSFCVVYLKEKYKCEVITVTVDTGGFSKKEIKYISKRSKDLGAAKHYFINGQKEVFKSLQYIIKGNILRGGNYPQSTAVERRATAKLVANIVKKEKASAVCHGSTGAGNDQVRFDLAFYSLLPGIEVIAPIRELGIKRSEETEFLKKRSFSVPQKTTKYSINMGMFGKTVGGGETHDSWKEIPKEAFSKNKKETAKDPETIIISFKKGLPVGINGRNLSSIKVIKDLNKTGEKHGVGRDTVLTTSIVGLKARIGIEVPAAHILIKAHQHLEGLTLTWEQIMIKDLVVPFYREYLHKGMLFDPVVKDIEKLIDSSQSYVTGDVKIRLNNGLISCLACKSPYSLMIKDVGSYGETTSWSGEEAKGFSKISGMQGIIANLVHSKGKNI